MTRNITVKIGITPSLAPFRMSCLRTFIYISAIAENNALNGGKSNIIFQIDNTNFAKRKSTNQEIIEFYNRMGILPFKQSDFIITEQTDLHDEYERHFNYLLEQGFIRKNGDLTFSFNINKYIETFGSDIEINDILNGKTIFNANNLTKDGFITIKRSDGTYLYNFCSAIDTIYWGYTTIIRGKDKISSAPFQNMLIKSLDGKLPEYFHLPLLLEEKKNNAFGIDARSDIRNIFSSGFSYMPVLTYLINTGYGDQADVYSSLNDFYYSFDVKFDFNIFKKTCNRFYQNDFSYDEYLEQLKRHCSLMDWTSDVLAYSNIGYSHKLSPEKIYQLYSELNDNSYDDNLSDEQKKKMLYLINELSVDYDGTVNMIMSSDKQSKKEYLMLLKYILIGHFNGLACSVYKDCYDSEGFEHRLALVKKRLGE